VLSDLRHRAADCQAAVFGAGTILYELCTKSGVRNSLLCWQLAHKAWIEIRILSSIVGDGDQCRIGYGLDTPTEIVPCFERSVFHRCHPSENRSGRFQRRHDPKPSRGSAALSTTATVHRQKTIAQSASRRSYNPRMKRA